jgi:hypothetical protein
VIAERGLLAADWTLATHRSLSFLLHLLLAFFFLFFRQRPVCLGSLDVSTLFDQIADFVRRHGQLALRTNTQCGRHQKIVAPSHTLC